MNRWLKWLFFLLALAVVVFYVVPFLGMLAGGFGHV